MLSFKTIKFIGSKSGHYFIKQQVALGKINGYIEEMINGQKVVKVFCHEEKSKETFDILNENMREVSSMPTNLQTYLCL